MATLTQQRDAQELVQTRALAVVKRSVHLRRLEPDVEPTPNRAVLVLQYQARNRVPAAESTLLNQRLSFSSRLRMLMGECVVILVGASGLIVVLSLVWVMSIMLRGIRALCHR